MNPSNCDESIKVSKLVQAAQENFWKWPFRNPVESSQSMPNA
jgi:hypothetical protein